MICAAAALLAVPVAVLGTPAAADSEEKTADQSRVAGAFSTGRFRWTVSQPLFSPPVGSHDMYYSIKDPSIVRYQGRWHLFCSIRGAARSHQIEYLSFADWESTSTARRTLLHIHRGFYCAPQVFYFTPQKKWYLICQASDPSWEPEYGAAYSTTTDIADPGSWSKLRPLGARRAGSKAGLDYWIICDQQKAHLFFTTLDGHMWREETSLDDFPHRWSEPQLAIRGDIFEAAHIYRLESLDKYLALIEAQGGRGWRYFKAYLADRLDGRWSPLAATREKAFASMANVRHIEPRWTDCISHGELLRAGCDQRLEVDPAHLVFLFQGVSDRDRAGKPYGKIPWRLGLLRSD